jgi:hypothetical protein
MLRTVTARDWDPNEWQAYCEELLVVHYGVRVQLIPDRAQGDGGLEAYVSNESIAFQCYAPESPFTLTLQTEAQKEKIRADTKKLIDNPQRTRDLIGIGRVIREWVLLTPSYEDKGLIAYANERARTVVRLAADHEWCDPDFRISVHDDSLFAVARSQLYGTHASRLQVSTLAPDLSHMREVGEIQSIEDTIDEKLAADPSIRQRPQLLAKYKDDTITDYFRGQNEIAQLHRDVPSVHRAVIQCRDIVFAGLSRSLAESDDRPLIVVSGIREKLESMLRTRLPTLDEALIVTIARYFIASWWIQCPLQFEAALNA